MMSKKMNINMNAWLLAGCLAIGIAVPASAQFDIVNNLASPNAGTEAPLSMAGEIQTQAFQTGPDPVELVSVSLSLKAVASPSEGIIQLRQDNAGTPGSVVATLGSVNPALNVVQTYTLPATNTVTLNPNTTYWVGMGFVSGDYGWTVTTSSNFTGVGTLLDADRYSPNNGANWGADFPGEWLKFSVQGIFQPATRYVAIDSSNPVPPYTNWSTAATSIQHAVDAAVPGDTVFVSNGVYQTGGRTVPGSLLTNRVVIDKPITVQSVNGPEFTTIRGAWDPVSTNGDAAVRGVWMTNDSSLVGFTVTNGATRAAGDGNPEQAAGGIYAWSTSVVVSNCVISGNAAARAAGGAFRGTVNNSLFVGNQAEFGGGALQSTLNNCTLTGNSATNEGGGAFDSILNNCTLAGNSARLGGGASSSALNNSLFVGNQAEFGGGATFCTLNNCTLTGNSAFLYGGVYQSMLNNCIVFFNTAASILPNFDATSLIEDTCTAPMPSGGTGNITNAPMFVDAVNSNFTLAAGSPCRDTGNNADAPAGPDLAGNPRIVNGYVDMGAFEYQGLGQGDFDGDGMGNGDERVAGTDFTDDADLFEAAGMTEGGVSFDSVLGRVYAVDYNDDLPAVPQVWTEFTNSIPGTGGTLTIDDPADATNRNYRVRVELE